MEFFKKTLSWTMLPIMVCSMNFAACSSDDDDEISSSIVGKWAFTDDPDAGFIFTQNGEMLYWEDNYEDIEGYYRQSGNKIIIEFEEEGEIYREELTIIKLTESTLVLAGYDEGEYEEMEFIKVK